MLNIHYFASIREQLGVEGQQLELPSGVNSVADLIDWLALSDSKFEQMIKASSSILIAVNQTVVEKSYILSLDDEVAFFPPMTGG